MDGKLYFRQNSKMYLKEYSKLTIDRIKALNEIRSITRHIIEIQSEGCSEEELKNAQRELNNSYDTFVDKYGRITSRANDRAFRDDADYPLLCSLENVDENGYVTKADMFYKQTIKPELTINRVETDRKSTRLNSSHIEESRMPSSA